MKITKRDGQLEEFDSTKLLNALTWACEGYNNVQPLEIVSAAQMRFVNEMRSSKVQETLIKATESLITLRSIDYQYVAARLLSMHTRKQIFGVFLNEDMPRIEDVIKLNIAENPKFYAPEMLTKFSKEDFDKLNAAIDHELDNKMTYSAYKKMIDSYCTRNRKTKYVFETPQYAFMRIAMGFAETVDEAIENYLALAKDGSTSYATPVLSGVGTDTKQFASCVLIDVDDTVDSMGASVYSVMKFISKKAGLGINFGRWRSKDSAVRGGEVVHTGIIPLLRVFMNATKSLSQGGLRGGAATASFPIWTYEFSDLIVLKNSKGNEDNRLKSLDYCVQLSTFFYKRMLQNKTISFFSTNDVPGLYEAFGLPEFDALYEKYEADKSIRRKEMKGLEVLEIIASERQGHGKLYIMNIDNVNRFNRFNDKIYMTNLCAEVTLPTKPIQSFEDTDGEIALCNLGSLNLGVIDGPDTFHKLRRPAQLVVRNVDRVITLQDTIVPASDKQRKRRSLGIGVTNFAYWMAKNKFRYDDPKALPVIDELFEHFQFYLIEASMLLAKEIGPCDYFHKTKWAQGFMPIDDQNQSAYDLTGRRERKLDWEWLRGEVAKYGLRNSVLSALMPVESSSLITNSTNGIEPPRDLLVKKGNETSGYIPTIVPEALELAEYYTTSWELPNLNSAINKITGVMQMWVDQAISVNHYYEPSFFTDGKVERKKVITDIIEFNKYGGKNLYYSNTNDSSLHSDADCESCKL